MFLTRIRKIVILLIPVILLFSCTHGLKIVNKGQYKAPDKLKGPDEKITIGLTPFSGTGSDSNTENWFHDKLRQRLSSLKNVDDVIEGYTPNRLSPLNNRKNKPVDLVISLEPNVNYESSLMNWVPINWPGFLLFAPGWNGYVYYVDIATDYKVMKPNGNVISESTLRTYYELRQADFDRAIWAQMGFLDGGIFYSNGTGIYYARNFDPDIKEEFRERVRDNYVNYVVSRLGFLPKEPKTEKPKEKKEERKPKQEAPTPPMRSIETEPQPPLPTPEDPPLRRPPDEEEVEPSPGPQFEDPRLRRGTE